MTLFFRLLEAGNKEMALADAARAPGLSTFEIDPREFLRIPGSPFAYWASREIRGLFDTLPAMEDQGREARRGPSTGDDFRRIRLWFEVVDSARGDGLFWRDFAKGGVSSRFYADVHLVVGWDSNRTTFESFFGRPGRESEKVEASKYFFRPGLTWPLRTQSGLGLRVLPAGCVFGHKGPSLFVEGDQSTGLLSLLSLTTSSSFRYLVELQMAFGSYEVGVVQRTPVPNIYGHQHKSLASLARRAWSLKRILDAVNEISHAFSLPRPLFSRLQNGGFEASARDVEIASIQAQIDSIAYDAYGLTADDRAAVEAWSNRDAKQVSPIGGGSSPENDGPSDDKETDSDEEESDDVIVDDAHSLLSWSIGVAFGRFDVRLATGERPLPPEPEPFDPLRPISPGMLPDGDPRFHPNLGILVDDTGHSHDLPHLIDAVLDRVGVDVMFDARTRLRREYFPLHLKQYSKSRRKAPIYWPLSTASGGYTLWLYYPALTDQTLFVAANDFVGAKLDREIEPALRALRQKTGRSREEERELENLQTLHDELRTLREELLRLAPTWKPHHDDGVQITAAPLWRLFRHRPWQTVLRDTWEKLEAGAYDWAHLAMAYWPCRVREKCRTDRSLAIAHDLEHLYEPPPEAPGKVGRGRKKKG
jgi:hypothetical protein